MRWISALILRLAGWRTVYAAPPEPKAVVIVYPHISNWDFLIGLLFKFKHRMPLKWAGKDSLFRWPLRRVFIALGGVPINRRDRTGMVSQLLESFARSEPLCLCIAPEGTRSKTEHWKSGFYHLALVAKLPLGLAFIDYGSKQVGVDRWVTLSGNEAADLAMFRDYYSGKTPRHPEKAGAIRFKA